MKNDDRRILRQIMVYDDATAEAKCSTNFNDKFYDEFTA